jgi:hypothetical protein
MLQASHAVIGALIHQDHMDGPTCHGSLDGAGVTNSHMVTCNASHTNLVLPKTLPLTDVQPTHDPLEAN